MGSDPSGMKLFALFQHDDELRDTPRAGFRLLRGLKAQDHGVAVLTVERRVEVAGGRVGIKRQLKVFRHRRATGGIVSRVPPPIGLGAFHFGDSAGLHPARCGEACDLLAVDLRPQAAARTRRELWKRRVRILGLGLTVNPAVAERFV